MGRVSKRSVLKKAGLIGCGIVALAIGTAAVADDDLFLVSKNLDIFSSVYKELNINYVDDVNTTSLMRKSIDDMLASLDPYTEYVPESDIEDYKLRYVSTQYGGIGASIFSRNSRVYIADVFRDFPAQKADIRAGDQILAVNGTPMVGKTSEDVNQMLRGPKNGAITLKLMRPGSTAPIEKKLVRDEIKQPNVSYSGMVEGNIGYIKLDKFLENAAEEVRGSFVELKKKNPSGIVLDLRNNGGGILQEAVKIVNFFVNRDVEVVSQRGKVKEKNATYRTQNEALDAGIPLVILVNNRSASASEIVAGSLQDLDRAVVIGQRSYGKGLVQQTFSLPYNGLVKITIAKYYTPSGRCIQALDYTHRTTAGNVEKVADSLITEYKTKAGRSVYDGSGIYPDIFVKNERYAQITQTLLRKFLVFDYANVFRNNHGNISDAKNFTLSDAEYGEFLKYISIKDYSYSTQTESILAQLKTEADREKKFNDIKKEYDALQTQFASGKKNDLQENRAEIKRILETEIVGRYFYDTGRLEKSFTYDKDLAKAREMISNKPVFASILKGEGSYKVIGKPSAALTAQAVTE
ncbi:MAG: S41 family peptidase [Mucilaginibacter polytrichastri]|nr:S41 family peptidase [Mucilaginibacter polytrichastri]